MVYFRSQSKDRAVPDLWTIKSRSLPREHPGNHIRGISTVGSARHSHCRGQGFDSPMLHNENGHPSRVSVFVMRTRRVRIPVSTMQSIGEGLALMTAGGRNLISASLMRNKRSPLCGVATIEHAEQGFEVPPVAGTSSAPASCETSDLHCVESRRLSLRNRAGSTPLCSTPGTR